MFLDGVHRLYLNSMSLESNGVFVNFVGYLRDGGCDLQTNHLLLNTGLFDLEGVRVLVYNVWQYVSFGLGGLYRVKSLVFCMMMTAEVKVERYIAQNIDNRNHFKTSHF